MIHGIVVQKRFVTLAENGVNNLSYRPSVKVPMGAQPGLMPFCGLGSWHPSPAAGFATGPTLSAVMSGIRTVSLCAHTPCAV